MNRNPTRRAALRALAGLPALLAARPGTGLAAALADEPPWLGFATARAERLSAPLATLSGRPPPGLAGVLWRNGPGEHDRFGHRYGHWFDGDGLFQAFAFGPDGVSHRARVLDTPKRRRETRAGRRGLPTFGTVPADPFPVRRPDDMNAANTAPLAHGGRLMALWEGGSALEVDPETLDAGGFVEWRADLSGAPFSAHPKVERDGTLWNIGCATGRKPMLVFYRIDRAGRLVAANAVPAERLGMAHDFVTTARHIVVLQAPFVLEPDRLGSGRAGFLGAHAWRPELGTRALAIDKDTLEVARRWELPAGFHFHHGNGWEEADGTIRLDLCQASDPAFVIENMRAVMRGARGPASSRPRYRAAVLRPDGTAGIEDVAPGAAEFPRIDPRRTGLRHRAVFAATASGAREAWPFDRISRLDPEGGEADGWTYPAGRVPEEHVFVPRGAAEGDGWLLGPFLDTARAASGLAVFDAARLADGPVWEGILPYPLPLGLHGAFQAA